jgi:hypothetical protein
MRQVRSILAAFCIAFTAACGGSTVSTSSLSPDGGVKSGANSPDGGTDASRPASQATVSGSVGGVSFAAKDAVYRLTAGLGSDGLWHWDALISTQSSLCTRGAGLDPGEWQLDVGLRGVEAGNPADLPPPLPATVPVITPPMSAPQGLAWWGFGELDQADATCNIQSDDADSGTLTITSLTVNGLEDANMAGMFDLVFPNGRLTGTFDVSVCMSVGKGACSQ